MFRFTTFTVSGLSLMLCLGVFQDTRPGNMPPGHPTTMPQIPPGHPPVAPPVGQPEPGVQGAVADVETVDAIIKAYYDAISGPKGEARNWDRVRSLFLPDARFVTMRPVRDRAVPLNLTVDQFISSNRNYFEKGGYFETEIARRTESFGRIAQVFSTYGSRRALEEPQPYVRGINGFQLLNDGERWWIGQVMWEMERVDVSLPEKYLGEGE